MKALLSTRIRPQDTRSSRRRRMRNGVFAAATRVGKSIATRDVEALNARDLPGCLAAGLSAPGAVVVNAPREYTFNFCSDRSIFLSAQSDENKVVAWPA